MPELLSKWNKLRNSVNALNSDCACSHCVEIADTARVILEEMDRLDAEEVHSG